MKLSVPFCSDFWSVVLRVFIPKNSQVATFAFPVNVKIEYNLFRVLCNGLCCWVTPAAEHLDCNCFPGPLICSELLSSAGGALRAAWVPAGQAACAEQLVFQQCSPFPGKTALQFASAPELGDRLNI